VRRIGRRVQLLVGHCCVTAWASCSHPFTVQISCRCRQTVYFRTGAKRPSNGGLLKRCGLQCSVWHGLQRLAGKEEDIRRWRSGKHFSRIWKESDHTEAGVKVPRNAPERRSGARKFKPGAFRLQNYWILQPEPTFLGASSYSNRIC